ncbi:hypothetical protein IFR05_001219 [Cadophora sp. M221]|nr:hypothetical protein IFR05_001219 [Cadophora sp. M221]
MNPDTDPSEVRCIIKDRFPEWAAECAKYFCHGPRCLFFSRSEFGLLVGGTAQCGIHGGSREARNIRILLSTLRREMLMSLDQDSAEFLAKCTSQPYPPKTPMTSGKMTKAWGGHPGLYPENKAIAVSLLDPYFDPLGPCAKCRSTYRFIAVVDDPVEGWNLDRWYPSISCAEDSWELKRAEAWKAFEVLVLTHKLHHL